MLCSGVLIDEDLVATAGHCIRALVGKKDAVNELFVRMNDGLKSVSGWVFVGDDPMRIDLAILRLREPQKGVTPIDLTPEYPSQGAMLAFVGFGCPTIQGPGTMMLANEASVDYLLPEEFDYLGTPRESLVICHGDSGGPMINISNWTVIGIASAFVKRQEGGMSRYAYSIFTNTVEFTRSILSIQRTQ